MTARLRTGFVFAGVVVAVASSLMLAPMAVGADGDTPEEPTRGGPVLTIPVATDDDAFAMVLVGGVAPQPRIVVGDDLEIDAVFAGSSIDGEVCVALDGIGCIGVLVVDPADRTVFGVVTVPEETAPGTYRVTLESASLGVVELGQTTVEPSSSTDAPTSTSTAPDPTEVTTVSSVVDAAPPQPSARFRVSDENRAVVLGAIVVVIIGLIAFRIRKRPAPDQSPPRDRLANLELPTATQLPDRVSEKTSAVAVRTRQLEPGEGLVLVALRRGEAGVVEDEIARYADLDTAMQGARAEAAHRQGTDVMWWEVRKHGSSLPVWLIEGNVTPVASGGSGQGGQDDGSESES